MGLQEGYTAFSREDSLNLANIFKNGDGCCLKTGGEKSMAPKATVTAAEAPKVAATAPTLSA